MARVFISYRRSDSAAHAGRLYDRLLAHFGKGSVFMDIDEIAPGEDFIEVINRSFDDCETVIVLIGPRWLARADGGSASRLDDPDDPVRMEVANALERKLRVVPVLVAGATMPGLTQLPSSLAPLSRRNAVDISDTRFHRDVDALIEALERPMPQPAKPRESPAAAAAQPSRAPETAPAPAPAPRPIPEPATATAPRPTSESAAAGKVSNPPRPVNAERAGFEFPTPTTPLAKALVAGGVTLALLWIFVVLVPSITRQTSPTKPATAEEAKAEPTPTSVASTAAAPAVPADDPQKRAAEADSKGRAYFFGTGVTKDYAQAAAQFRIAADLGNADSQGALGHMTFEGLGVKQDQAEGIRLLGLAAEAGVADAQNNLGAAYEEGKGVKQDYGEALRLYRKAAESKYGPAQFNLGRMYENGLGVKRDLAEARRWYRLAQDNGETDAADALKRLGSGSKAAN
jgi:TPR repeat protein